VDLNLGRVVVAAVLTVCASAPASAQTPADDVLQSPDALVRHIYDLVTFEAGTTPDWEVVRSMFIDDAVIVLRTSRDDTTVFSVDGFVDDFVAFIERADAEHTGFTETVIRTQSMEFGDMAHVLVLYEASIPGSERPPQQGVDSFQLIKKGDRWWIVSITNEIPTMDRPIPPLLQE
jgi:ketosteroid isomerase-like protein